MEKWRQIMLGLGGIFLITGIVLVTKFDVFGGGALTGFGFIMAYLSVRIGK
jgi:hypothetical protein